MVTYVSIRLVDSVFRSTVRALLVVIPRTRMSSCAAWVDGGLIEKIVC
jgi:hypothetical protein